MRALRHPIETFRTAPVQLSGLALEVGIVGLLAYTIESTEGSPLPTNTVEATAYAANIAMGIVNGIYAGKNIALRNRLEASLERTRFNERAFSVTTETFCGRQAARIACENYDVLPEYEAVCDQNSSKAQLMWVPHI